MHFEIEQRGFRVPAGRLRVVQVRGHGKAPDELRYEGHARHVARLDAKLDLVAMEVDRDRFVRTHAQRDRFAARDAHRAHAAFGFVLHQRELDRAGTPGRQREGREECEEYVFAACGAKVHSFPPRQCQESPMTPLFKMQQLAAVIVAVLPALAAAQIHAMFNYETKSPDSLKVLKTPVQTGPRKEGIAIIDADPQSKTVGQTIQHTPVPADPSSHHLSYNSDQP